MTGASMAGVRTVTTSRNDRSLTSETAQPPPALQVLQQPPLRPSPRLSNNSSSSHHRRLEFQDANSDSTRKLRCSARTMSFSKSSGLRIMVKEFLEREKSTKKLFIQVSVKVQQFAWSSLKREQNITQESSLMFQHEKWLENDTKNCLVMADCSKTSFVSCERRFTWSEVGQHRKDLTTNISAGKIALSTKICLMKKSVFRGRDRKEIYFYTWYIPYVKIDQITENREADLSRHMFGFCLL